MKESTSITSKGQVTVPVQYRRRLKLRTGQRMKFEFLDGKLTLQPLKGFASLIGSFKTSKEYSKKRARETYLKDVLKGKI